MFTDKNARPPVLAGPSESTEIHLAHLHEAIEAAAHLLPAQGPITAFVHHNTLHAFEDLPFDEAVRKGGRIFGCHPYLTEARYREEIKRGRIRFADLQAVLTDDLGPRGGTSIPPLCTRFELRMAILQFPLVNGSTQEMMWSIAETDALRKIPAEVSDAARRRLISEGRRWVMRDLRGGNEAFLNGNGKKTDRKPSAGLASLFERLGDATLERWSPEEWEEFTLRLLWWVCSNGVRDVPAYVQPPASSVRHRDLLLQATGTDIDSWVNEILIRFCASFLDQGVAHWPLPNRNQGVYETFCALYRLPGGAPHGWMKGLAKELDRLVESKTGAMDSIRESLDLLGIPESEWEEFLSATFLALRGWGGMVHQMEMRGDRVAQPAPGGSLVGFLAVRLLLERYALAFSARSLLRYNGPLSGLRVHCRRLTERDNSPSPERRAFLVFQLAQVLGWAPDTLYGMNPNEWARLIEEIEAFTLVERQRILHGAYERHFVTRSLDTMRLHRRRKPRSAKALRFQAVFCLDEREESVRRHLEELAPDVETFGAAGFYGVVMYYRGAADAHFLPLCPVVIRPQHWVTEEVEEQAEDEHRNRAQRRRALGKVSHQLHLGSRTFALGALIAGTLGVMASVPLVARILFPRLTARIRGWCGQLVHTPPHTRLRLERRDPNPGEENGNLGFSVDEMAISAERLLRDMGMTERFAPFVLLVGHGSDSLNNPHNSAYNCGACSGAAGGPNARAMAQILNDPRIRERLALRGIAVPAGTRFVGGYHNTCDDSMIFYDTDGLDQNSRRAFDSVRQTMQETCKRNAHERCRRFMSASLTMSFEAARRHVEGRSEDLAQTRPECGHATNALCIVGRREMTRGLFLDRRAFLTSYDPTKDDADSTILTRILQAVFPVCAGINLEYYFSYVDPTGWGCGTKLPHNVTSLLGVMDGAASDLRTGLPWQMVEIHEPVRLLMIIETSPEAMQLIMARNAGIGQLCRNNWVLLSVIDPETREISVFRNGHFEPYLPEAKQLPKALSSVDWYRGWRDHLDFAEIESRPT